MSIILVLRVFGRTVKSCLLNEMCHKITTKFQADLYVIFYRLSNIFYSISFNSKLQLNIGHIKNHNNIHSMLVSRLIRVYNPTEKQQIYLRLCHVEEVEAEENRILLDGEMKIPKYFKSL